jgi:hypothetical protein
VYIAAGFILKLRFVIFQDSDDEKDNKNVKQSEPETPPKTPPKTPQKVHEKPPKAAKAVRTPTPGKSGGRPPKPEQREEAIAKTNKELAVVKNDRGGRDLLDVFKEVDECFLKAAASGEDVSRMLETRKAHYHSSFSDNLKGTFWGHSFTSFQGPSGFQ